MRAEDIHARIGSTWPQVLERLGIPESALRLKKAGPCPACGGADRYTFDNRRQHGDFFCRRCGPGSGFDLLMRVHGWDFKQARQRVLEAAGLQGNDANVHCHVCRPVAENDQVVASPTPRVWRLLKQCCQIVDCLDVVAYLEHRNLWPLPQACALRAHPSVAYFESGSQIGRFPALVAPVTDIDGEIVTLHITYLRNGRKLGPQEPRKLLTPLTGRTGCCVRLMPPAVDILGVGEGIETCLAAAKIHKIPVWAALNTTLMTKFEPPVTTKRLVIFADRDTAGMEAAAHLAERLQGRINFEIRAPAAPAKDWNDSLQHRDIDQ
jgi:putative DNA primase/helicase